MLPIFWSRNLIFLPTHLLIFCIVPCLGKFADKTLEHGVIIQAWRWLMCTRASYYVVTLCNPFYTTSTHTTHSRHTWLWSLRRGRLSPKFGKFENWLKVTIFDAKQHSWWYDTVSNIFWAYLRDLLLNFWEIYQKCSNSVNFGARKMFFFFKWVRISPEIDWYHH